MKIAIIGSRTFEDYSFLKEKIQEIIKEKNIELNEITVVSGGAKGADFLGKKFSEEFSLNYIEYPADWERYGRGAGPIRNKTIVQNSDLVIAFIQGVSKGTKNAISQALKLNKEVIEVNYEF